MDEQLQMDVNIFPFGKSHEGDLTAGISVRDGQSDTITSLHLMQMAMLFSTKCQISTRTGGDCRFTDE
jgi:hypothetical protein